MMVRANSILRGFTLLELLVVTAIIVLVLGFTVPAITGLSKSNDLNSAGRMISNLLTVARSEAINRRALIRFEVATTWPPDPSMGYRKLTLVQHDAAAGTDTQLTGWETLPIGITFSPTDPGNASGTYFFALSQTQTPKLKFGASDIDSQYLEFLPTGGANIQLQNSPIHLRLLPGYVSNGRLTVTTAKNWFDYTIDGLVGRIAIARP